MPSYVFVGAAPNLPESTYGPPGRLVLAATCTGGVTDGVVRWLASDP